MRKDQSIPEEVHQLVMLDQYLLLDYHQFV
jgi:hypothetical protein